VEEQGIYRSEVIDMLGALADVKAGVVQILRYIENGDEEEAEEDE
jgi:hypothetical protein